nr:hypothetical protein [Tanacetum cinerariifolium]
MIPLETKPLILSLRYVVSTGRVVVPTGRVVVPTGRYVVPVGNVIIEDASKQERSIEDIDQDAEIALVDESQMRMDDADMFGFSDLEGNEVIVEKEVSTADPVTTAGEVVNAASVEDIQAHKPTISSLKDKGKAKMIEPKKRLKKKDQIALDEEVARKLEAKMRAEREEEERIAKEKDDSNRAVIEE